MSGLPNGWISLECGDTFEQISTSNIKVKTKQTKPEGQFPVIDQGMQFIAGYVDDEDSVISIQKPVCIFGDHTRIVKWVDFNFVPGADGTKILAPKAYLYERFFYYQLRSIEIKDRGYSRHFRYLRETTFKVAPLNEQIRIADKLDSILTKVNKAQERLEKIPNILKRFRQSVLAAATSGELTREWREENGLSYEWQSIKVSTLVSKIEAGKNIKCDERPPHDNEFGIIKISAVTWGFYDEAQSKTLKDDKLFIENRRVGVGDFLISRANTLELLGMPVIVKKVTKNLMLSDKVLRLVMPEQEKAWLDIFLRSPKGRLEIQSRATGNQESMRNIGQKALFDIDVLLPTSIEKTEIVKIVGLLTSHVEMLEKQYLIIKSRLDKLAQSILAKAFRGELVEQDSNDEPASLLLERIKLEQLEEPKPAKRTRSTKDKAAQKVEEVSSTEASEESIQLQSEVLSMLQKANVELSAEQLMDKLTDQSFDAVDVLFTELKRLLDAAVITKAGSGEHCTFKANKK